MVIHQSVIPLNSAIACTLTVPVPRLYKERGRR